MLSNGLLSVLAYHRCPGHGQGGLRMRSAVDLRQCIPAFAVSYRKHLVVVRLERWAVRDGDKSDLILQTDLVESSLHFR